MGFNKRYVPEVVELKKALLKNGSNWFYKIYVTSPDALIGPCESIEFIEKFQKNNKINKTTFSDIIINL